MALLTMMAVLTVAIVVQRNLFAVVVFSSMYSFFMATVLVALDAVDVAMTEASVGAGMSTVLLLGALYLTRGDEVKPLRRPVLPLFVAMVIGAALVYGLLNVVGTIAVLKFFRFGDLGEPGETAEEPERRP